MPADYFTCPKCQVRDRMHLLRVYQAPEGVAPYGMGEWQCQCGAILIDDGDGLTESANVLDEIAEKD